MTYKWEGRMEGGQKQKTHSTFPLPPSMPLNSLPSLSSMVLVQRKWWLFLVNICNKFFFFFYNSLILKPKNIIRLNYLEVNMSHLIMFLVPLPKIIDVHPLESFSLNFCDIDLS
jgi:hypothetical protein